MKQLDNVIYLTPKLSSTMNETKPNKFDGLFGLYASGIMLGVVLGVFIMVLMSHRDDMKELKTTQTIDMANLKTEYLSDMRELKETHTAEIKDLKEEFELTQIYLTKAEVALGQCLRGERECHDVHVGKK